MKEEYLQALINTFEANADLELAARQQAYLRHQFKSFGIKTPVRRAIQKDFLRKENLPDKNELPRLIKKLWERKERECHYFAQELFEKYDKKFSPEDIELMEYMVTHQSWWDTVDFIAVHLIGKYFQQFPKQIPENIARWLASNNIWLQRCCLLFQLKYRNKVDTELLSSVINRLKGSSEFFINKAIGWILREYSKTNPEWVVDFVENHQLHSLSRKEALRLLVQPPINQTINYEGYKNK